ncbi:MAG: hypothetical protein V7785_01635 [Bermanella sp.]
MHQPKLYLLIIAIVLLGTWLGVYYLKPGPESVKTTQTPESNIPSPPSQPLVTDPAISGLISKPDVTMQTPKPNATPQEKRHIDMLSEEMKQSIRDKLFHHGPKDVIKRDDGTIILPSNGRFTQMPVAVEMPDGTIKIQEYSVLPE